MKSVIVELGKFAWNGSVINQVIPCDSMETAKKFVNKFLNKIPTLKDVTRYNIDRKHEDKLIWAITAEFEKVKEESYIRIKEYDVLTNIDDWFVKD